MSLLLQSDHKVLYKLLVFFFNYSFIFVYQGMCWKAGSTQRFKQDKPYNRKKMINLFINNQIPLLY